MRFTVTVCVITVDPKDTRRIWPEYVPPAIPWVFTATCKVAAVVPLVGVTVSQGAVLAAVHANAPPVADRVSVWAVGFGP